MENPWNCNSPTLPADQACKERMERLDARNRLLRELEAYLEAVKASDRPLKLEAN